MGAKIFIEDSQASRLEVMSDVGSALKEHNVSHTLIVSLEKHSKFELITLQ